MIRRLGTAHALVWTLIACVPALSACGGRESGEEAGESAAAELVRAPIMTEMRTILRDIRSAQERAAAISGAYLQWDELRRSHMSRPVPEKFTVQVDDVTADGFRARVEHDQSGLACELVVRPGPGSGSPDCS